jgi:hypothetical protein
MNTDTGEFKMFSVDEDMKPPWREWSVDELIEIKGGLFQVSSIDVENDTVTLKGRNKQARKPLAELFEKMEKEKK